MQRKAFQLLFSSALKASTCNRITTCSGLHTKNLLFAKHVTKSKPPKSAAQSVEKITDFANYDPDEFGTLSNKQDINQVIDKMPEEFDHKEEFDLLNEEGKKQRRKRQFYHELIYKLLQEKKIADALDVLEVRMLKKDKVRPNYHTYNLLINGCARVGYCQKAFKLYNDMKQRDIKCTGATYTGLFNACANTPFPEDGLIKVNSLRQSLGEKGVALNQYNYNALIKAYARLKDIKAAFYVADEMLSKKYSITCSTCCMLLQACISDREAGFRHALLIWHKMRAKKVPPTIHAYNLFLRCVRDCGLGDQSEAEDVIKLITDPLFYERSKRKKGSIEELPVYESTSTHDKKDNSAETTSSTDETELVDRPDATNYNEVPNLESTNKSLTQLDIFGDVENRPNLLCSNPHLGSIIALKEVKTESDRFLLLGGFKSIVQQMKEDKVTPDIKTYTLILDCLPSTLQVEEALLKEMQQAGVEIDIDFCNMLIKKRAFRNDYESGRKVLELIQQLYLNPDIVTFGVLALCCKNKFEAKTVLKDMSSYGYRPNMEILGAMLKNAAVILNFDYVRFIMRVIKAKEIDPNLKIIEVLDALCKRAQDAFQKKKDREGKWVRGIDDPEWYESYQIFKDYYKKWKQQVNVSVKEHPYKQFHVRHETKESIRIDDIPDDENAYQYNIVNYKKFPRTGKIKGYKREWTQKVEPRPSVWPKMRDVEDSIFGDRPEAAEFMEHK